MVVKTNWDNTHQLRWLWLVMMMSMLWIGKTDFLKRNSDCSSTQICFVPTCFPKCFSPPLDHDYEKPPCSPTESWRMILAASGLKNIAWNHEVLSCFSLKKHFQSQHISSPVDCKAQLQDQILILTKLGGKRVLLIGGGFKDVCIGFIPEICGSDPSLAGKARKTIESWRTNCFSSCPQSGWHF